jgi:hypothetical protein
MKYLSISRTVFIGFYIRIQKIHVRRKKKVERYIGGLPGDSQVEVI